MKLLTSLLSISVVIASQLAIALPSKASFEDEVLMHLQALDKLIAQEQKTTEGEMKLLAPCRDTLIAPDNHPSPIIDYCERLLGIGANYQLNKHECFSALVDPSEFPGGIVPYCEKVTGKSYVWVQEQVRKGN